MEFEFHTFHITQQISPFSKKCYHEKNITCVTNLYITGGSTLKKCTFYLILEHRYDKETEKWGKHMRVILEPVLRLRDDQTHAEKYVVFERGGSNFTPFILHNKILTQVRRSKTSIGKESLDRARSNQEK